MTLIFFTTHAPTTLAVDLVRHGHEVYEALAISEVLALAEQYPNAGIVITPGVDRERTNIIQQHYPTIHLNFRGNVQEILWELNIKDSAIQ